MTTLKWTKSKPKFTTHSKECLLIAANKFTSGWEYHIFEIKKAHDSGQWYWGIFGQDGDEWGDYADLKAQRYAIIKPLK